MKPRGELRPSYTQ